MNDLLQPIRRSEWNPVWAAHLLNRAGFGADPETIADAAQKHPAELVEELVDYETVPYEIDKPTWIVPGIDKRPDRRKMRSLPEKERRLLRREQRKRERKRLLELRAWWLYRMRYSPRPLQEKLTLFWHGHFATGFQKVRSAYAMFHQNETLRAQANGNWKNLVVSVSKDPAMLIYLDNARSRKKAPNENYARELMELFTLGEGNYTEDDIRASARAFTGWTLERGRIAFQNRPVWHDPGIKRFFKSSGRFDGEDIIERILHHPRAAPFIAGKLWRFFAYEDPEPELEAALGRTLKKARYEFKPLLKTMFLSRAFYSKRAVRTQIKSPVQWLIGSLRELEAPLPAPRATQRALHVLGQDLFAPPNVKGWDGGRAWITTATLFQRYNLAGALVKGEGLGRLVDPLRVLPKSQRRDRETACRHLQWRLFQAPLRPQDEKAIRDLAKNLPPPSRWTSPDILNLVHLMMSTPQFQLT